MTGKRVPDGRYRVRVTLRREGRSVTVPRTTLVDTQPPRPRVQEHPARLDRRPVGTRPDPRSRSARCRAGCSKRARVYRIDDGAPRVVAELPPSPTRATLAWDGRVGGKPAPAGDVPRAGDRARPRRQRGDDAGQGAARPRRVARRAGPHVRTIAAEPPVRPVTAGQKVRSTSMRAAAPTAGRCGALGTRPPGRARQGEAGAAARGSPRRRATRASTSSTSRPARTRRGPDPRAVARAGADARRRADDDVDRHASRSTTTTTACSNTFTTGAPVSWPRVQPHDLPADLLENVAPLLRLPRPRAHPVRPHERPRPRAVALAARVRPPGRAAAGAERWISRGYARRLRQYVLDGGRLASFGTDSLRRGVTLRRQRRRRPRGPAPASDAAVGHRPVRRAAASRSATPTRRRR